MPSIGVTVPTLPPGVTNAVSLIFGLIVVYFFLTNLGGFIAAIGEYGQAKGVPKQRQEALSAGIARVISMALLAVVAVIIASIRSAIGA